MKGKKIVDMGLVDENETGSIMDGYGTPPRQEVEICKRWIERFVVNRKSGTFNMAYLSDILAMAVAKQSSLVGATISQGAFIQAAAELDIAYEGFSDSRKAMFDISIPQDVVEEACLFPDPREIPWR